MSKEVGLLEAFIKSRNEIPSWKILGISPKDYTIKEFPRLLTRVEAQCWAFVFNFKFEGCYFTAEKVLNNNN